MRNLFRGFVIAGALLTSAGHAAAQSPLSPAFAGFYAGAAVGFEQGRLPGHSTNAFGAIVNSGLGKPRGFTGGLLAGYNLRSGPIVYGLEADVNLSSARDPAVVQYEYSAALRARLGYAFDNLLVYAAAGATVHRREIYMKQLGVIAATVANAPLGWTISGGVEYAFAANWTMRAEYRYSQYRQTRWTEPGGVGAPVVIVVVNSGGNTWRYRDSDHALRIGVARYF